MSSGPLPVEAPERSAVPIEGAARRRLSRRQLRWILPLLALAVAFGITRFLEATKPQPEKAPPQVALPVVRVEAVAPRNLRLQVVAHGTVTPRTESDLVAEVRGRVVEVSPSLVAGGSFSAGEELLRFDGREYSIAVDRARATLALRRSEAKLATADLRRRRALVEQGVASSADLEQFESRSEVANASLAEAAAQLAQAELDLERTVVRAPFDGRVRGREVDVGQFVNPGAKLARVYADDYAEVRLPLQTEEISHLDLPFGSQQAIGEGEGAPVVLQARLGGKRLEWPARLIRTEGEIDLRTRMLHVVARVDDPYARKGGTIPLPAGLFVRAEIQGREIEGAYVLPASALRDDAMVYVVDPEDRLRIRPVEVLRRGSDEVVITSGLGPGERVIVSPMRIATEGMRVRTLAVEPSGVAAPATPAAPGDSPGAPAQQGASS